MSAEMDTDFVETKKPVALVNEAEVEDDDRTEDESNWENEGKCKSMLIDSAASDHIVADQSLFDTYVEYKSPRRLKCVNSDRRSDLDILGKGCIRLITADNQKSVCFNDVLHVPGTVYSFILVSKLARKGFIVTFDDVSAIVREKLTGKIVGEAPLVGNLYYWRFSPKQVCAFAIT